PSSYHAIACLSHYRIPAQSLPYPHRSACMRFVGVFISLILIAVILYDGFETILQPRRVTHRFRVAAIFYRTTWRFWRAVAMALPARRVRQTFLSIFGPLSLLALFIMWVFSLILGFALLHWSLGTILQSPDAIVGFPMYLYLSGTTF